jgi:ubiquinone/menaquinone biosynthesis C-methylase UbiE
MEASREIEAVRITKKQLLSFGIEKSFDTRVYFHPISIVGDLFWRRFTKMVQMAQPKNNEVALDFGCGHGLFLPTLSEYYKKVVGIDINIHRETGNILKHFGCRNVKVLKMDGNNLKFKKDTFDVVFAADSLEHFKEMNRPLRSILRVLKPNGELIVNSPLETNFFSTMRQMAGYSKPRDHYYGASEIYREIEKFFKIEEKYNFPNFFGKFRLLEIVRASKVPL